MDTVIQFVGDNLNQIVNITTAAMTVITFVYWAYSLIKKSETANTKAAFEEKLEALIKRLDRVKAYRREPSHLVSDTLGQFFSTLRIVLLVIAAVFLIINWLLASYGYWQGGDGSSDALRISFALLSLSVPLLMLIFVKRGSGIIHTVEDYARPDEIAVKTINLIWDGLWQGHITVERYEELLALILDRAKSFSWRQQKEVLRYKEWRCRSDLPAQEAAHRNIGGHSEPLPDGPV